jgi:hypothetical protein
MGIFLNKDSSKYLWMADYSIFVRYRYFYGFSQKNLNTLHRSGRPFHRINQFRTEVGNQRGRFLA